MKLRNRRTDSAAALTLTRMTMICNYNVHFPFRSWGDFSCPVFLYGYNVIISRQVAIISQRPHTLLGIYSP